MKTKKEIVENRIKKEDLDFNYLNEDTFNYLNICPLGNTWLNLIKTTKFYIKDKGLPISQLDKIKTNQDYGMFLIYIVKAFNNIPDLNIISKDLEKEYNIIKTLELKNDIYESTKIDKLTRIAIWRQWDKNYNLIKIKVVNLAGNNPFKIKDIEYVYKENKVVEEIGLGYKKIFTYEKNLEEIKKFQDNKCFTITQTLDDNKNVIKEISLEDDKIIYTSEYSFNKFNLLEKIINDNKVIMDVTYKVTNDEIEIFDNKLKKVSLVFI